MPDRLAFTQLIRRDKLPAMPLPLDSGVLGEPRVLFLIVGGTDFAYTDPRTGVQVIPIQALQE